MFQRLRFSTRAHLFALGLAIVTPLLVFGALILFQYAHYERERSAETAEQLAATITRIIDSELEQGIALLRGLAGSGALADGNYAQFYDEARRALGR